MKYFTLQEFIVSATTKRLGINNTPAQWQVDNINELVDKLLDPLREAWSQYCIDNNLGSGGIHINSGVRSEALNKAINGSKTSAHMLGAAADIVPTNGHMAEFKKFCIGWLKDKTFDQFISEEEDVNGTPRWIHLGYKNSKGTHRKQFLKMINNKYYYL